MITLFAVLLIIRWQNLPVFLDIYYHAGCMTGFKDAGGIVLHDFWDYAPAGRPHLYPPLFHVVLLGLSKLGMPTLFIIRLVSAAIYPLLLLAILWVVTKLYDDRLAFFMILAASLPYTFFLNVITAIPSSISLIILILLFYSIETKRVLCGILLLGLSFYTHGGLPWMTVFTLILYAVFKRDNLKAIFAIMLGGIVLGSPWLIHMIRNKSYFMVANAYINNYLEVNAFLYIFAILGLLAALKQKSRSLFYLAMFVGMMPMMKDYAFRFFCGEGLLPLIFLAGIGLDESYLKVSSLLKRKTQPIVYTVLLPWLIFYLATFYSPGASFLKFANYDSKKATALESSIYPEKHMEELSVIIKRNTRPDEIIYCNYDYVAGILYMLSGRVTSSEMLNEVRPAYHADPVVSAALIVWIKNPEGIFDPELKALIERLRLVKVAETEFAYVYRNPVVIAHRIIDRPIDPANLAFLILFAWIGAIFICLKRYNRP